MGLFGTNTMTSSAEVMDSNPVQAWIFFRPYFTTVKITLIFTFLSAVHMIYIDSHSFIYHFKSLLVTNITTSSLLALTQLVELQWYCRCHGFKSLTGLNFFRPHFHYCSSSVYYCRDHFRFQRSLCFHSQEFERNIKELLTCTVRKELKLTKLYIKR